MPKIVDHEKRREEVLEATWRVVARAGIEGATIREIAREVGYSNGVLAHYFRNKDDILMSASKLAYDRVADRVAALRSEGGDDTLREAIYQALPLDDERRLEAVIDVSFWAQALSNTNLSEQRKAAARRARAWYLELIADARAAGEITISAPDEVLADELHTLIDGISMHAVVFPEHMDAERQIKLAEHFISTLHR